VANQLSGNIGQYDIAANGALSPKTPPTVAAGTSTSAITVSPDGNSVYATNAGMTGLVRQYDVAANGTLSPKTPETLPTGERTRSGSTSPPTETAHTSRTRPAASPSTTLPSTASSLRSRSATRRPTRPDAQ
jgi:hypothetical protein